MVSRTLTAAVLLVALAAPAFAESRDELLAQVISGKFPQCIRPAAQHTKDDCAVIRADLNTLYEISIRHGKSTPTEAAKWAASKVEADREAVENWRESIKEGRYRWIPKDEDGLRAFRRTWDILRPRLGD